MTTQDLAALRARLEERTLGGIIPAESITVRRLAEAYQAHAHSYYTRRSGSSEATNIRDALAPVVALYGDDPAETFDAMRLRVVREWLVEREYARSTINQRIQRVRRAFRWAVSLGHIPGSVASSLEAVDHLKRGRSNARETTAVRPVRWCDVEATFAHLRLQVVAMIKLQWFSGCRPGEAAGCDGTEIETVGTPWIWRPSEHKNAWRGHTRTIYLGPQSIDVLRPWLRAGRLWEYREGSYYNAIRRACRRANVGAWTPNQLRHAAATRYRKAMGIEAAALLLGHSEVTTTQIYAERDEGAARAAALRLA